MLGLKKRTFACRQRCDFGDVCFANDIGRCPRATVGHVYYVNYYLQNATFSAEIYKTVSEKLACDKERAARGNADYGGNKTDKRQRIKVAHSHP